MPRSLSEKLIKSGYKAVDVRDIGLPEQNYNMKYYTIGEKESE